MKKDMMYNIGDLLFFANTARLCIQKVRVVRREEGICGLHYEHYWIVNADLQPDAITDFNRAMRVTKKQLYPTVEKAWEYLCDYVPRRLAYEKSRVEELERWLEEQGKSPNTEESNK